MILAYRNPRRRALQALEIGVLVLLLPLAVFFGLRAQKVLALQREVQRHYAAAHQYLHSPTPEKAVAELEACLLLDPSFFPAYDVLASYYFLHGQRQKAVEVYRRGMVACPRDGRLHRELGRLQAVGRNYAAAEASLVIAVALLPADGESRALLAWARSKKNTPAPP